MGIHSVSANTRTTWLVSLHLRKVLIIIFEGLSTYIVWLVDYSSPMGEGLFYVPYLSETYYDYSRGLHTKLWESPKIPYPSHYIPYSSVWELSPTTSPIGWKPDLRSIWSWLESGVLIIASISLHQDRIPWLPYCRVYPCNSPGPVVPPLSWSHRIIWSFTMHFSIAKDMHSISLTVCIGECPVCPIIDIPRVLWLCGQIYAPHRCHGRPISLAGPICPFSAPVTFR